MPDPRTRFKGLINLGAAIDARIHTITNRMVQPQTSTAASVPVSQGGYPGGSGQDDEPAFPESWVESLAVPGAPDALSGPLVLSGGGDTTVAQSAAAPHFTVSSPRLTAGDGVRRDGDELSADATVVRTSGDQAVGGVKSFGAFPLTPACAPQAPFEAANKQYVDDQDAQHALWLRQDAVLTPRNAGDGVALAGCLQLERTAAGQTALATGTSCEAYPRFVLQADGAHNWGGGAGYDVALARLGPQLLGLNAGGAFCAGAYCDFELLAGAPGAPEAGRGRMYLLAGGRACCTTADGAVHDLCVAHRQCFPAAGGVQGVLPLLAAVYAAYPAGAVLPAGTSAAGACTAAWAAGAGAGRLTAVHAVYAWESSAQDSAIAVGAQLVLGAACRRHGACARLRARMMVNNPARFDGVYLVLGDCQANSCASANLLGAMAAGEWYDAVLDAPGLGTWAQALRLSLCVQGTSQAAGTGVTQLYVESLGIEQWAQ